MPRNEPVFLTGLIKQRRPKRNRGDTDIAVSNRKQPRVAREPLNVRIAHQVADSRAASLSGSVCQRSQQRVTFLVGEKLTLDSESRIGLHQSADLVMP